MNFWNQAPPIFQALFDLAAMLWIASLTLARARDRILLKVMKGQVDALHDKVTEVKVLLDNHSES